MHAVCRKRQGIPWKPEKPHGFEANARHLVGVAVQPNPMPPSEETLMLAYGDRAAPKLVGEINSSLPVLRLKALQQALKQAAAPKELAALLTAGLVAALVRVSADADDAVRISAALALAKSAAHDQGREHLMVDEGAIDVLTDMAIDANDVVRSHGLTAMIELAKVPKGASALIAAGVVKLLVLRCETETPQLQPLVLMALAQMMSVAAGLQDAIDNGALETITPLLTSASVLTREKAALALASYTVNLKEKKAATLHGGLAPLLALLGDEDMGARKAAAQALMVITVEDDCKSAAVQLDAPKKLTALLQEAVANEVRGGGSLLATALTINVLQAISHVCEHPLGRKQLQKSLPQLEPLAQSTNPQVQKAAAKAVDLVKWKP